MQPGDYFSQGFVGSRYIPKEFTRVTRTLSQTQRDDQSVAVTRAKDSQKSLTLVDTVSFQKFSFTPPNLGDDSYNLQCGRFLSVNQACRMVSIDVVGLLLFLFVSGNFIFQFVSPKYQSMDKKEE